MLSMGTLNERGEYQSHPQLSGEYENTSPLVKKVYKDLKIMH